MKQRHYLILLVENNAGVLTRISSLFMQRGFNIDTLTVASTDKPGVSRITVSFIGDDKVASQLISQTEKLIETKLVICVEHEEAVLRELLLVKIETNSENLDAVVRTAAHNHFRIVDSSNGCMVLETSGSPEKIEKMLKLLEPFDIVEMCRTGVTALEKGKVDYNL